MLVFLLIESTHNGLMILGVYGSKHRAKDAEAEYEPTPGIESDIYIEEWEVED